MTTEQELRNLRSQAESAAKRLAIAEHTPMTDDEWEDMEDSIKNNFDKEQSGIASAHSEVWNQYTHALYSLCQVNKRIVGEARYWKQKYNDHLKSQATACKSVEAAQ